MPQVQTQFDLMRYLFDKIRRLWLHISFNYREGGVRKVVEKAILRLRGWYSSEDIWLIYAVDLSAYSIAPSVELKYRMIDIDEIARVKYHRFLNFPDYVVERLNAGEECHAFYRGKDFVNLHWLARGYLPIEQGVCVRDESSLGVFDGWTVPAFRGRGINTASHVMLATAMRARGFNRAITAVHPSNGTSIRCLERAGYRFEYRLTRSIRFGSQRIERSDQANPADAEVR